MKINRIVRIASRHYPAVWHASKTKDFDRLSHDHMASCVMSVIASNHDPKACDPAQLWAVLKTLKFAQDNLNSVVTSLEYELKKTLLVPQNMDAIMRVLEHERHQAARNAVKP